MRGLRKSSAAISRTTPRVRNGMRSAISGSPLPSSSQCVSLNSQRTASGRSRKVPNPKAGQALKPNPKSFSAMYSRISPAWSRYCCFSCSVAANARVRLAYCRSSSSRTSCRATRTPFSLLEDSVMSWCSTAGWSRSFSRTRSPATRGCSSAGTGISLRSLRASRHCRSRL